ncbi:hypothetical protein BVC80_8133g2 [Macleaya cordata]|uniref:Uncharacterized protein n=1 Tax=Macleaya cordata TaxID=56857 RepID=A0A200QPF0_MACCD|nr:hypothetical protein BVC80_8133g2 [Macleaya cordata]
MESKTSASGGGGFRSRMEHYMYSGEKKHVFVGMAIIGVVFGVPWFLMNRGLSTFDSSFGVSINSTRCQCVTFNGSFRMINDVNQTTDDSSIAIALVATFLPILWQISPCNFHTMIEVIEQQQSRVVIY